MARIAVGLDRSVGRSARVVSASDRATEALGTFDWARVAEDFETQGFAVLRNVLDRPACLSLIETYQDPDRFRSTVVMESHGFGVGRYRYFDYPLPSLVETLRKELYRRVVPIANQLQRNLGKPRFPPELETFLTRCARAGQKRPTPLILGYGKGGYNCLHRDLYGSIAFPLQANIQLSRPGRDFEGGHFLLVEGRARRQSRAEVVELAQGDLAFFPVHERAVKGARGFVKAELRHGVSRITRGERFALGLIFHDAK